MKTVRFAMIPSRRHRTAFSQAHLFVGICAFLVVQVVALTAR